MPNVFQIWTACHYFPLFMVGMKLRDGSLDFLRKIPLWGWIVGDVLLFLLPNYLPNMPKLLNSAIRINLALLLHIVGALMAFFVLQKIATLWDWENSKWLMFLKQHNVTVYLFHQQIIYFVIVALNGVINPYLHMGVNFIVSLSVSLVIAVILSRFRVTRFLIGMK